MSFRRRLTVFFVLIVIVPMISVTFVLFRLIEDNERGKADARLAARQETSINLFREARLRADTALEAVGGDPALARALQAGDPTAAERRAGALLGGELRIRRIAIRREGRTVLDVGARDSIAPAVRDLVGRDKRRFGRLQVSVQDADAYGAVVERVAGADVVIRRGRTVLASTLQDGGADGLPDRGDATVRGVEYRVVTYPAPAFNGAEIEISVLTRKDELTSATGRSRLLAAALLLGFFILAFTFALAVSRSLQQQVANFLDAARRLGGGDLGARVPTVGDDEFAALGGEFNKMAAQLEARLEELRRERERVQHSMRRLGQAVASNLDRDALLEIVVETAVEGVGAEVGRAMVTSGGELVECASAGDRDALRQALEGVERAALTPGAAPADGSAPGHSLAHVLRGGRGEDEMVGVVSVARADRPFTGQEAELFHYLAAQAGVSMENVGLHETATRESVTDELTGLANRRRFDETLADEVERARRFGQPVGLALLDIDDFKQVNDTYGHQQGDIVLREVARVLRASLREIDEPARYGGEELAVVLPGTDAEGARRLAERVRQGIAGLELPLTGADGVLRITASLGVSAMPESADDEHALVAAADAALYDAKRGGKNRVVRAQPTTAGA